MNAPEHSAESDAIAVFPPGSRVRLAGAPQGYVFLVVVGGYVVEDTWHFHSSRDDAFTSDKFECVTPPESTAP